MANDVSERAFQLDRGGQWSKGKSSDNFLPLCPWLVTADKVADPQKLSLTLEVNGVRGNSTLVSKPGSDLLHVLAAQALIVWRLAG